MIRNIITAHITADELPVTSLLANNRSVGALATGFESEANFVLNTNRDIHYITGFSQSSNYYDPRFNRDRAKVWEYGFREMTANGLSAFPEFIADYGVEADFLILITDYMILAWQDAGRGLYLHRAGKFYRLQPTILPKGIFPETWMSTADFYAFKPRQEDLLLRLPERFVDLFDYTSWEAEFVGTGQAGDGLGKLLDQARVYEEDLDISWLAVKVQKIETNLVRQRLAADEMTDDPTVAGNLSRVNDFTRTIVSSRVSRVKYGQKLILPTQDTGLLTSSATVAGQEYLSLGNTAKFLPIDKQDLPRQSEEVENIDRRSGGRRPTGTLLAKEQESFSRQSSRSSYEEAETSWGYRPGDSREIKRQAFLAKRRSLAKNKALASNREQNLHELRERRTNRQKFLDNLQEFSFEPYWQSLKNKLKKLLFRWNEPLLNYLFTATVFMLSLLILVSAASLVKNLRETKDQKLTAPQVTARPSLAPAEQGARVEPPAKEDLTLEVPLTVQAINLQVRQAARADAALVATLSRGETITQLTEPVNGWVYVRLKDGETTGYVAAEYLFLD